VRRVVVLALLFAAAPLADCGLSPWNCVVRGLDMGCAVAQTRSVAVTVEASNFYDACDNAIVQGRALGLSAVTCESCTAAPPPAPPRTWRPMMCGDLGTGGSGGASGAGGDGAGGGT
jgi:hypothetical protein